jgi:hypothetical protein
MWRRRQVQWRVEGFESPTEPVNLRLRNASRDESIEGRQATGDRTPFGPPWPLRKPCLSQSRPQRRPRLETIAGAGAWELPAVSEGWPAFPSPQSNLSTAG